jgi:hypothetical protein
VSEYLKINSVVYNISLGGKTAIDNYLVVSPELFFLFLLRLLPVVLGVIPRFLEQQQFHTADLK